MRYRAKVKAHVYTIGKLSVTIPNDIERSRRKFEDVLEKKTSYDFLGYNSPLKCERIVGNRKFTPSSKEEIQAFLDACVAVFPAFEKKRKAREAREKRANEAYERKEKARRAKKRAKELAEATAQKAAGKLPPGIEPKDVIRPEYEQTAYIEELAGKIDAAYAGGPGASEIEFWETTEFGWVIPTLTINRRFRNGSYRTYAVTLETGKLVSVGQGPHVTARIRVFVSKANRARLTKAFSELVTRGSVSANEYRDRLSSRRAAGRERRSWY